MDDIESETGPDATETPAQAWKLMVGVGFAALALLLMVGHETQNGPKGGGWWNEPALGPIVALLITAGFALPAAFAGRKQSGHSSGAPVVWNLWIRAVILSVAFIVTLWSIHYVGYAVATFLLAGIASVMAGFRGRKLLSITFLTTLILVVSFRVVLGIWFPMAAIFKLVPVLAPLGRYL